MKDELRLEMKIKATPQAVWAALTEPDLVAIYMFGSRVESDWQPDSEIRYVVDDNGSSRTIVHGTILQTGPPYFLKHTLFPSTWAGMADIPENHLIITYTIESAGKKVRLTIQQNGFATAAEGEKRYNDSIKGWQLALPKLAEVAEHLKR